MYLFEVNQSRSAKSCLGELDSPNLVGFESEAVLLTVVSDGFVVLDVLLE